MFHIKKTRGMKRKSYYKKRRIVRSLDLDRQEAWYSNPHYGRRNTQRESNFRVPFLCHDVSTWRRVMLLTHVQTCDDTLLSKCYGMDCFGTNLTHVQTCDDIRARSALQLTASVHT